VVRRLLGGEEAIQNSGPTPSTLSREFTRPDRLDKNDVSVVEVELPPRPGLTNPDFTAKHFKYLPVARLPDAIMLRQELRARNGLKKDP